MKTEDNEYFEAAKLAGSKYLGLANPGLAIDHSYVESADAYRFFNPVRGGASIIVGRDGSILFANSSVPPQRHVEAYLAGRRTDPKVFDK